MPLVAGVMRRERDDADVAMPLIYRFSILIDYRCPILLLFSDAIFADDVYGAADDYAFLRLIIFTLLPAMLLPLLLLPPALRQPPLRFSFRR
jgi:hypothetical protein